MKGFGCACGCYDGMALMYKQSILIPARKTSSVGGEEHNLHFVTKQKQYMVLVGTYNKTIAGVDDCENDGDVTVSRQCVQQKRIWLKVQACHVKCKSDRSVLKI